MKVRCYRYGVPHFQKDTQMKTIPCLPGRHFVLYGFYILIPNCRIWRKSSQNSSIYKISIKSSSKDSELAISPKFLASSSTYLPDISQPRPLSPTWASREPREPHAGNGPGTQRCGTGRRSWCSAICLEERAPPCFLCGPCGPCGQIPKVAASFNLESYVDS